MTPRPIWVGPTKCDSERDRRTRFVDKVWNKASWDVGFHMDLGNAVDFFREALSCYQNGAFMATALMCRSSIQTAVYLSISRKRTDLNINMSLDNIKDKWLAVVNKARNAGMINHEIEGMLKHITKKGDFAAHYCQKFDQKMAQGQGIGDLWISAPQAREILRQSEKILEHLHKRMSSGQPAITIYSTPRTQRSSSDHRSKLVIPLGLRTLVK